MEFKGKAKYLRISPLKLRAVVNLIRGKTAAEAIGILSLVSRKGAKLTLKALNSILAAAKEKNKKPEELIISNIQVQQGPVFKRFIPAARGIAKPIRKRTAHLFIELKSEEKEEVEKTEKKGSTEENKQVDVKIKEVENGEKS